MPKDSASHFLSPTRERIKENGYLIGKLRLISMISIFPSYIFASNKKAT